MAASAHPDLRIGDADRLRHRLFDLRVDAAGQFPLRARRSRGEPAVGADASGSQQVACVNPVTFSARAGACSRSSVARRTVAGVRVVTPWVTFPGLYTAHASRAAAILVAGDGHVGAR